MVRIEGDHKGGNMCLTLLLLIFGIFAFTRGSVKITNNRMVTGDTRRLLGVILLAGAGLSLIPGNSLGVLALGMVIVIGLVASKPIAT